MRYRLEPLTDTRERLLTIFDEGDNLRYANGEVMETNVRDHERRTKPPSKQ